MSPEGHRRGSQPHTMSSPDKQRQQRTYAAQATHRAKLTEADIGIDIHRADR